MIEKLYRIRIFNSLDYDDTDDINDALMAMEESINDFLEGVDVLNTETIMDSQGNLIITITYWEEEEI